MLRTNTTVVAVVAPAPGDTPLKNVRSANVHVFQTDAKATALERASRAWEQARRTTAPYLLHDADPLAWVADSWVRLFDGHGAAGELEVAVAETVARWRAGSLELPDYYLLVDAEALGPTFRHWFFGVLASAAPTRVAVGRRAIPLVENLPRLRPGPWWPGLDRLLTDVGRIVPDHVATPTDRGGVAGLVVG